MFILQALILIDAPASGNGRSERFVGIPDKGFVPGRREAFDEWRVFHREPTHR
jgi:hypothetical protein